MAATENMNVARLIVDYVELLEKYPRLEFAEFVEMWLVADEIAKHPFNESNLESPEE